MKSYVKLLNWEMVRFSKLYGVLALLLVVSQFSGIWLTSVSYLSKVHSWMENTGGTEAQYAENSGKLNLSYMFNSLWFSGVIFLCGIVLVLYIFMIWYKEWFGRNTFAYRLLMLPTSRMQVYMAKLSAILLFMFGFVALQITIIPLQIATFHTLIPSGLRHAASLGELIRQNPLLDLFLPRYFIEFILYYGAGIMGVIVLFTAILLERSYRWKGIVAGVLFSAAALFVIVSPHLLAELSEDWFNFILFPSEILLTQIVFGLGIITLSLSFSSFLIRKKVTV